MQPKGILYLLVKRERSSPNFISRAQTFKLELESKCILLAQSRAFDFNNYSIN